MGRKEAWGPEEKKHGAAGGYNSENTFSWVKKRQVHFEMSCKIGN